MVNPNRRECQCGCIADNGLAKSAGPAVLPRGVRSRPALPLRTDDRNSCNEIVRYQS